MLVPFLLLCFLEHMIATVVAAISTPTIAATTPILMMAEVSNKCIVMFIASGLLQVNCSTLPSTHLTY